MDTSLKDARLVVLEHRRARAHRKIRTLRRVEARFPWIRLGTLVLLALAVFVTFDLLGLVAGFAALMLALGIFGGVARMHQGVIDRIDRLEAFSSLLSQHIARLKVDWPGIPAATTIAVAPDHPFAADLNILGDSSLHQLLDTTIALGGSQRLAAWLLSESPDLPQIERRQRLVRELLARPGLPLHLELEGLLVAPRKGARWDSEALLRWLQAHAPMETLRSRLQLLSLLAAANIVLFALNAAHMLPVYWLATMGLYLLVQASTFAQTSEVFADVYTLARQLGQFRAILTGLECRAFSPGEELAEVFAPFTRAGQRPSAALRRIGYILPAVSLRNNAFLSLLLNLVVPWDLFFAFQFERQKRALQAMLPGWLDAWYELEALAALANFAALNPGSTFPELTAAGDPPVLEVAELGHPLIPDAARVTNDFAIQSLGEVVIITGSNMSGKSTFLRTVGVALALAFAGSAVPARSLRARPLRLFSVMQVTDSLSHGVSFFYAEVRRLKALLDQLNAPGQPPLLFLIDEIFRGTNNRERRIGSHAYTAALINRNGAGLISTHDLELAALSSEIPQVRNLHFREEIRGEEMVFDYRLRPGPSPTTNALKIMALAGLPVPEKEA